MSDKKSDALWYCKIGFAERAELPRGCDYPMRLAVADAFERITGHRPDFIFSGWGATLTDGEQACLDDAPKTDPMDSVHVVGGGPTPGQA